MSLSKLNPVEPPWYVTRVWEGWHREVSPYPDQYLILMNAHRAGS